MAYAAELCGKKLRAQLGATLNESAAGNALMAESSFGRKQLEKMGWKEGQGLGKDKHGMKSHIQVQRRTEENGGLGHETKLVDQMSNKWWSTSVEDTLFKLQQKQKSSNEKKKKKKKDKKKKDKKKDKQDTNPKQFKRSYTDEELFEATGGARFGMRAQRRAEAKWARTEKIDAATKQMEQEAEKAMEWNGLGDAKLLLTQYNADAKKPDKIKRKETSNSEKKKKKEEDEKRVCDAASVVTDSENDDQDEETQPQDKKEERRQHKESSSDESKKKKKKKKRKRDEESCATEGASDEDKKKKKKDKKKKKKKRRKEEEST